MPVPTDIRSQLTKIDEEIIDLLAERAAICQKALEEDEEAFSPESQAEIVADWEAAGDEKGLSMPTMGALCKQVIRLCQSAGE